MIKGVTHAHLGPIWYHPKPQFSKLVSWLGLFFAASYSKTALETSQLKRIIGKMEFVEFSATSLRTLQFSHINLPNFCSYSFIKIP